MMRALVEPCWAAMRLPSMFLMPLIGLPFLTRNWAPVTKKVSEKSTLSRRARVSVMVSAIRSTALDEGARNPPPSVLRGPVAEGRGAGPGADGERARLGDLVQRALLLGERRGHPGHEQRQRHHESHQSSHSRPPWNGLVQ